MLTAIEPTHPLSEDYEALAGARARSRSTRGELRTWLRTLGWLARWLFGVVPVGVGTLWILWAFVGHGGDWSVMPLVTVIAVNATLMIGALLLHPGLAHRRRGLGTFALGASTGLVLALFLCVRASWRSLLPEALALPLLLLFVVTEDGQLVVPAFAMQLWFIAPLPLLGLCAWDAARAVWLLRGRAFGFRDCAWILLGLLLAFVSTVASGVWMHAFVV